MLIHHAKLRRSALRSCCEAIFWLILCFTLNLPALAQEPAQEPATQEQPEPGTEANAEAQSSSARSSEAPLYNSRKERDQTLLANALSDEAQWLETEHGKVLALQRITEIRKTHGVLLILHAGEDPEHWPPELNNIRMELPRYGWETLAINLPQKSAASIPERVIPAPPAAAENPDSTTATADADPANPPAADPEAAVPTEDPITEAAAADDLAPAEKPPEPSRTELIQASVKAAFEFLQQQGQFNVVLLVDNSSVLDCLSSLLSQIKPNPRDKGTLDGPIQALILTNLQPQEALTKDALDSIFSAPQLPVMDIFFKPDSEEQKAQRRLQQGAALRNKLDTYNQVLIDRQPQTARADEQSFILGRVRGFMMRNAKGIETKK
jgi:hypothetical protein